MLQSASADSLLLSFVLKSLALHGSGCTTTPETSCKQFPTSDKNINIPNINKMKLRYPVQMEIGLPQY